ncbi:hypothetical protein [Chroococcidiopsis sp.]|uniref:hypothetical protein n=1 Tax=Chroococcidiopsis sp. TaxID=3088168 RepID=UPI003F3E5304
MEIDKVSITKLEKRYSIAKSVLYDRMNALGIKPEKIGNRSYLSGEQLQLLDELQEHMKSGGSLAMFADRISKQTAEQSNMMVAGQTTEQSTEQSALLRIVTASLLDRQPAPTTLDPFENRRKLKEIAEEGWHISTSELLPLLGLKSIPPLDDHNRFTRMGFVFWKVGKVGREYEWRITKVQS